MTGVCYVGMYVCIYDNKYKRKLTGHRTTGQNKDITHIVCDAAV